MNILFITHYSNLYGANRSLLLLMQGLKKRNINLLVFLPKDGPLINELEKLNIPFCKIRFWAWMGVRDNSFILKSIVRFITNLLMLPILLVNALRFKPSLIYTNTSTTPVGMYLALILRLPHIWHIRELGKLDYNLDYDFGKKYFYHFMLKSDAIICISEFVRRNLFKGNWDNVSVINNAVFADIDLIEISKKGIAQKKKEFTFLMMSIIHPSKGIQDAIEALEKVKKEFHDIKLLICGGNGDKKYREYLERLVTKLDLSANVVFEGFVKNPHEMYRISDAVLVCSRNEAWGRVAAEAMIFGKPVIGYKSGGTMEIITDKVSGLLYETVEELVTCMKLVMNDREMANNLISNAKSSALKKYSQLDYVEKIYQVISKLAKK